MNHNSLVPGAVVSMRHRLRASARDALVESAERVAARDGVPKASLQAIATDASIAVGTIYNYFKDRKDLFDELFRRRRDELYVAIDESSRLYAQKPFDAQLDSFVRTVLSFFDTRRDFLRIALETETGPTIVRDEKGKRRSTMAQLESRALPVVRTGLKEKRLRDESANWLATVLVALVRCVLVAEAEAESNAKLVDKTDSIVKMFLCGASS